MYVEKSAAHPGIRLQDLVISYGYRTQIIQGTDQVRDIILNGYPSTCKIHVMILVAGYNPGTDDLLLRYVRDFPFKP